MEHLSLFRPWCLFVTKETPYNAMKSWISIVLITLISDSNNVNNVGLPLKQETWGNLKLQHWVCHIFGSFDWVATSQRELWLVANTTYLAIPVPTSWHCKAKEEDTIHLILHCPTRSPARKGTINYINKLLTVDEYAQTGLADNSHIWIKTILNGSRGGQNRTGECLSGINELANRLICDLHRLREILLL